MEYLCRSLALGIVIAIGILLSTPVQSDVLLSCPVSWIAYSGKCYKTLPNTYTFPDAQGACQQESGFSYVAVVNDAEENAFIAGLSSERMWLGCNETGLGYTWTCPDGSGKTFDGQTKTANPVDSYWNWATGEPRTNTEECQVINQNGSPKWDDYPCTSYNFKAVCELESVPNTCDLPAVSTGITLGSNSTEFSIGDQLSFFCANAQLHLDGETTLTCQDVEGHAQGVWSAAPPRCVPNTCDPPTVSTGVTLGSNSTEFSIGEQLSFACASPQYHMDGETTLVCQNVEGQAEGVWSAAPPTCVPNTCDPPTVSTGVTIGSNSTEFSIREQLSFSCASAQYHIDGETTLMCQNVEGRAKGVWSAAPPTCVSNTCTPPTVSTGVTLGSSSTEFSIGEQLSFFCASAQHHMDGETTLMCRNVAGQGKGVWSASPPTCVPNTCDPPTVSTGVSIGSTATEFSIGEQLSFFCASPQHHIDGDTTLMCQNVEGQRNGVWSGAPPTCVPSTCDPPAVSTGVALGSTTTEFSIGEQLSFFCASPQHHIDGDTTLMCQNVEGQRNGVWSGAPPTCVPNTCDPPAVSHGVTLGLNSTEFSIGDQLSFACASPQYHVDAETTLMCQNVGQAKGVWSAAPPTCVPNTCDPPALSNGVVFNSTSTKFNIGEQLSFSCASAQHYIAEETTLMCQNVEGQVTGVWSAAPPTCGPFPYCPENWDSFGKYCYLVNTAGTSFSRARADCQRLGSNLTSIGDAEEHMFHKRLVLQAGVSLWIGLHDVNNEDNFEWIDGSPFNFESWNAGEPNDWRFGAQEDCVHLVATNGHWNDRLCTRELGFICKQLRATRDGFCPPEVTYSTRGFMTWQEYPVGQTSFSKETCDVNKFNSGRSIGVRFCSSEYEQCTRDPPDLDVQSSCPDTWIAHGSKCYKLITRLYNFPDAQRACQRESQLSYVAVVNDADENAFIAGLSSESMWLGCKEMGVGYTWTCPDGSGKTFDGRRRTANPVDSYWNWGTGQPQTNTEECQVITNDRSDWHDWHCTRIRFKAVCELEGEEIDLSGKRTRQSTTMGYGLSDNAVDGNTNGIYISGRSCTHTHGQRNPWWYVDLVTSTCIDHVVLFNRLSSDCCEDRLSGAIVRIGNDEHVDNNPACPQPPVTNAQISASQRISIACNNLRGRYISVHLLGSDKFLTLCEVKAIQGVCSDAEAHPGCERASKEGKWSQVDDIPCDNVVTEYVPARCQSQLGMEDRRIQDSQITVSSMYNTKHAGHQGRLNYIAPTAFYSCCWCSLVKDRDQWIQVDFNHRTSVTGVILQGRDNITPPCNQNPTQWVTKFKVQYGQNGRQWNDVKNGNNKVEIFNGNTGPTTPVTRYFHTPVVARFIRIRPWEWFQGICMRFELLGCQECPAGWDVNGDYCYYVNTDRITFSDAQSECQRLDSNLTSIHNADEQIYHTLQAKAANEYLWIGLHDRVGEQRFTWVDGTEDDDEFQPPWAPFQPDNGDNEGEDCVHLRSGRDAGLWADLPCTSSAGYICKRPKVRRDGMCPAMITSFHRQIDERYHLTWENALAGEIAFSDEVCPDDSPNAAGLPIAMRVCSETSKWANDILLNCFKDEIEVILAPVLSAIVHTCAAEQTHSDNGITLHWSETEVGDSTFSDELCPNDTEHAGRPIAFRGCAQDYYMYAASNNTQGLWQPVKMLGCHGTIYNTTILTESDMDAVSRKLLHFTRSMRSANMNDIHAVAWMVKNIASMESSSNQVLESVTQAINTLVEVVDPTVRLEPYDDTLATSMSDMVLALEKQVATTMEEKDKVNIVGSSLAIVGIRLFANDHLWELCFTTYQASDDLITQRFSTYQDDHQLHDNPFPFVYASATGMVDETNDVFGNMEEEEKMLATSIQIPSSALELETNSSKPVSFISYGDDFLFPSDRLATDGLMVDAPIITTTLTATNLTEPVRIRFRLRSDEAIAVNSNTIEPSEGMSESSHRCVFWDDQLHGGVGDWSDNGCEVAGTVDALRTVTCHCYHLSTFAVLSTDISHQYERQSAVLPVASKSAISFISLVPVVMTLIILLGFRKLRETRAYHTLCNFTVAILVLQVIFAAGIDNTDSSVGCILVASLLQYFTLVSFLWLAADIRFDYGACKTPSSDTASHIQTAALMKAYAISWGTPIVVVGVTLAISFHDYVNTNFCAVTLSPALFYGTVIPVALIVLHNLFIHASYAFVTLKKPPSVDGQLEVHRSSQRLKAASIVSVALLFTLCLAYLFLANPDVVVMRALYGISEVFMSVLIFCMFCLYLDEVCEMVIPKKYRRHQDDAPEHDNFINPSYELDDNPCSEKAMINA